MPMLPKGYKRPATGQYVKLESGNTVLRILDAPVFGYEGWSGERGSQNRKPIRHVNRTDFKAGEVAEDKENRIKYFWAMPVWNYNTKSVQVWQVTQAQIQDGITVLDNNAKWGDAREYDLCIVREGEGLDTTYSVMPEPKTELPMEARQAWDDIKDQFNINALFTNDDPFTASEEIPLLMSVRTKVEAMGITDPAELCKAYIWQHAYRLKLVDEYGEHKQWQMEEVIAKRLGCAVGIDKLTPIELSTLASVLSGMR